MTFVYKACNNLFPECMDSILLKCFDSPYGLRSRSKHQVIVSHFNTDYMKQSIYRRGSILWNRMIDFYIDSKSTKHFCKLLTESRIFLYFNFDGSTDQCKPKYNDMRMYS